MGNIQTFIDSIEIPNTKKVVRFVFKDTLTAVESLSFQELEQYVLDQKPNSPKAIITIRYVISLYASWLQQQGNVTGDALHQRAQALNVATLWKRAKPTARKKFISNPEYERVLSDICMQEYYNPLYYRVLFRSIYEGIYNDDLSVLKNLRASDIHGNIVTLREDNDHSYELVISDTLASELLELSCISIWKRPNRNGVCRIHQKGLYKDTIFKIEDRKTTAKEGSYQFSYYARLRKISNEYLGYQLLPLQLFVSGIMYRINLKLHENGLSLKQAFSDNNRKPVVHTIISNELLRCNRQIEVGNLRELVKGHLDVFDFS